MYKFPVAVDKAFDCFESDSIRLVGGCVRDLILQKEPKDWDMCTTHTPDETMAILEQVGLKPFDLSNGHGTISFVYDNTTVEITTLRIDKECDGRWAEVAFVTDYKLDAARRDFTFNAMSMDKNQVVYDYFNGERDLINGIVKFVGKAENRIKEDYLRILRFYRFYGRYTKSSTINDVIYLDMHENFQTFDAICNNVDGLKNISGERIWMEMQQIFAGPKNRLVVELMKSMSVFDVLGVKVKLDMF